MTKPIRLGRLYTSTNELPTCPCCKEVLDYELDFESWEEEDTCGGCGAKFSLSYDFDYNFDLVLKELPEGVEEDPLSKEELEALGQQRLPLAPTERT